MNINSKSEEVFANLKRYIEKKTIKSGYTPHVYKSVVNEKYPLVVFETKSNKLDSITQDMFRLNQTRSLSFEINIFAENIKSRDGSLICDELANLVCEVMQEYYLMQGGIDAKLKNINSNKVTQYILHFSCKWDVRSNRLYRN